VPAVYDIEELQPKSDGTIVKDELKVPAEVLDSAKACAFETAISTAELDLIIVASLVPGFSS
jgi:hypothetical protein